MRLKQLILISLSVFLIVGCNKSKVPQKNELVVGLQSAPKSIDSRYAVDASGMRIAHQLLSSSLIQLGYDLQIVPELAEKWETPDDKTIIFTLRKGVTFHDGTPLMAEDVKFTFEHLMDPATKSPFMGTYKGSIESIEVLDPYKVKFSLFRTVGPYLASLVMPIVSKKIITQRPDDYKKGVIGTGPFKLVSHTPTEVILVKNENYFGSAPKVDRVVFKVIQDDNTRYLKVKKGDLQILVNALSRDQVNDFKTGDLGKTFNVEESAGLTFLYLSLNFEDPTIKKKNVRKAIAHAINRGEIIEHRLKGHAMSATGLLSSANWFYEKNVPDLAYDPALAVKLLNEAGFRDPDGEGPKPALTLELKTSTNPEVVGIARILQSQLSKVGIKLELKSYEWGTFYSDFKKGNFQMVYAAWSGATEPDFYYDIFHTSKIPPNGRNRGRYKNVEIDKLVEEGRMAMDPKARKAIYSKVQKIVAEDLPYVNLWHYNNIGIYSKDVTGYKPHPTGGFYSFKDIAIRN